MREEFDGDTGRYDEHRGVIVTKGTDFHSKTSVVFPLQPFFYGRREKR